MIEIKQENVIRAYKLADDKGKSLLKSLFPDIDLEKHIDDRPVTERIKTFGDALDALGADHPFVIEYNLVADKMDDASHDLAAYMKLRIVVAALNEGWQPEFAQEEYRWFPFFYLYKSMEDYEREDDCWKKGHPCVLFGGYASHGASAYFVYAYSYHAPSDTDAHIGSRLCLKSEALSDYCGKQFADLWLDFYLVRKNNNKKLDH